MVWKKDRNEESHITFWASGYGLRRGFIDIQRVGQMSHPKNGKSQYLWFVHIYKNKGHYEDAEDLGKKSFKTKNNALSYANNYMRLHPNG